MKKPDFLGASMWEFHYEGRTIQAGILDADWLDLFRRDGLGIRPCVALRALARVQAAYDDENEALPAKYTILKVHEVIPPPVPVIQMSLNDSDNRETLLLPDCDGPE